MTYMTISGDTWDKIAYQVYGTEQLAGLLMDANTKYLETVIFPGGILLNVPNLLKKNNISGLPPWK